MAKIMRPFKRPWLITKIIPPSCHDISDKKEKLEKPLIHSPEKNLSEPGDN
jgi:hypothetical protein